MRAHVNIIVISLHGSAIKQVELARFLGVHIDANVNWKSPISQAKLQKFPYTLSRGHARSMLRIDLSISVMVTLHGETQTQQD